MENFLVLVHCITPVLLTMCLGMWLRTRRLVPEELYGHLSTLYFHGLLPFRLFYNVYDARMEGAFSYPMALACGSDHERTAQVVVTTSMLFCLSMLLWIFALKQLALI